MKTTTLIFLSLIAFNAQSKTLGAGMGACLSAELFDQFVTGTVAGDEMAIMYLIDNGCIITNGGQPVSVLNSSWDGIAHVRAYTDTGAVELWTYRENIID